MGQKTHEGKSFLEQHSLAGLPKRRDRLKERFRTIQNSQNQTTMQANDIFHSISPALAETIFRYFREEERDAYRSAIANLAEARKLRPVFIQKKPVSEQMAWMRKQLAQKSQATVAEHLLQIWLVKDRPDMLVDFLDAVGIKHDGKGEVEELPDELEADKVREGAETLLKEYPAEEVAVYLHLFQLQRPEGWPEIESLLKEDERLALHPKSEEG